MNEREAAVRRSWAKFSTKVFLFDLGAIVRARGSCPDGTLDAPNALGTVLVVASRWVEECPGGLQIHYVVRPVRRNGDIGPAVQMLESLLEPSAALSASGFPWEGVHAWSQKAATLLADPEKT